jgi:glycoprotein endo-alpha-1,2-mannosidase
MKSKATNTSERRQHKAAQAVWSLAALLVTTCSPVAAALFQHLDASTPDSVISVGGQLTWLDQSGGGRNAVNTSAGSGSVSLSSDDSVFPTGLPSVRFSGSNWNNYGRFQLLSASASDEVLNQSGANPTGFSVFVVAKGDAGTTVQDWNDLIGNTTDVGDGAFLMRYNAGNGVFQGAAGGLTVQNNNQGQSNYSGEPTVLAFNYNPAQPNGEITLASSLNGYSQTFNLSSQASRDFSNNDPLTLGKAFDTIGRLFVGNIGEVKIFDEALSTQQFAAEVTTLNQKWNVSPDGRLDIIVDRATGGVTLRTYGSTNIDLAGLRLKSASGSLDPSDWLSITDHYDANSGGAIDGNDAWLKLSQKPTDLSEATFGTGTVAPGAGVSLGSVFRLGAIEDIQAEYADPITQKTKHVHVRYASVTPADLLPGDFNDDGVVNATDYTVWRDNLGAVVTLPNEVSSNGRVSQEDYDTWRAAYGTSAASTASAATPEPGALSILVLAIVAMSFTRLQRVSRWPTLSLIVLVALLTNVPRGTSAAEATVGAYYYPWWDTHDWDDTLRAKMLPEDHMPMAGYTPSSDADLIAEHINQSHRGNISMWATSWWGPGSIEDVVLQQHILTHPRASELSYAIHYETTGRFNGFETPTYSNLVTDFEYLAENVFSDPNYYRIDGRPVVFMYVSRAYFNDPLARQALDDARAALVTSHGYDPYVVGDEIFDSGFNASRAAEFDAVTTYDVFAMSGFSSGTVSQADIQQANNKYAAAAAAGATVIPAITPGYNDKAVRDGNRATGRYFSNQTIAQEGSVFTSLIDNAAAPNLNASTGNLLMVNSFNEWHEDTQIEPTIVAPPSSTDNSPTGTQYTQGVTYEGYGYKYLDLLRTHTTEGGPVLIDGDANFDGDLDINDVAAFVQAWGAEHLVEGVRVGGYASRTSMPDFNYDGVVDFEDWFVIRATVTGAATANLIALLKVPEPDASLLVGMLVIAVLFLPTRGVIRRDSWLDVSRRPVVVVRRDSRYCSPGERQR